MQKKLVIKMSGRIVYENTGERIYRVYHDSMLKDSARSNMIEGGVGSLLIHKKVSKDDASNCDAAATLAFNIYRTKQRIHLNKIISENALYTAFNLSLTLT